MPNRDKAEVIADYFAAIRNIDVAAWLATLAADAVSHDPVGAPPHSGHDALRAFFQGISGAFDKVDLKAVNVFIAGNEAAVKWDGYGLGKNGREVNFEGIDVFSFNDAGEIQQIRAYWNPAETLAKLMG